MKKVPNIKPLFQKNKRDRKTWGAKKAIILSRMSAYPPFHQVPPPAPNPACHSNQVFRKYIDTIPYKHVN